MLNNLDLYVHRKFTAGERHILLSKWVGEAWEEVCAKPEMIIRSFRKCGISVAVDGSEDEVININGVDDYTVGSIESSDDDDIDTNDENGDDNETGDDRCEESDAERSAQSSNESDNTSDDPFEDERNVVSSSDAEDESIEVHSSTSDED